MSDSAGLESILVEYNGTLSYMQGLLKLSDDEYLRAGELGVGDSIRVLDRNSPGGFVRKVKLWRTV